MIRGVYIHAASVGEAHGHFAWLRNLNLAYTGLTCVERLVTPYCAIPRDYLSDTPLLRAMGFLVS